MNNKIRILNVKKSTTQKAFIKKCGLQTNYTDQSKLLNMYTLFHCEQVVVDIEDRFGIETFIFYFKNTDRETTSFYYPLRNCIVHYYQ